MKRVVLALVLGVAVPGVTTAQVAPPAAPQAAPAADRTARAYDEFLNAHYLENHDQVDQAIAAYQRAMALDPAAAQIPAELATLYMRQNRASEAINTAQAALKIDPDNHEANRVLGLVFGAIAQMGREGLRPVPGEPPNESLTKAIGYLEKAVANPVGEADPTARATLARLYVRGGQYDKAIPLLKALVDQEPGWSDGPALLAEAYAGAGRTADAIAFLEDASKSDPDLLPTLADFYERDHRWKDAATAYGAAVAQAPASHQLEVRYASALINAATRPDLEKARTVLDRLLESNPKDTRALYLLSQAERRLGDLAASEATARKMIAQDARAPWGYYALAETLEERRQYQAVLDALLPALDQFRNRRGATDHFELTMLLPHVGFAYQELHQYDKAIATFDEAHTLAPDDANLTAYLIDANISAKKYGDAVTLAEQASAGKPPDLRIARLQARALHLSGRNDAAIGVLQSVVQAQPDDPAAYVALAQAYTEANRGGDAVKLLEDARAKIPGDDDLTFELGAVLDRQKRFGDAEAAFRQLIDRDPDNAAALNYLGYMLADRGERLDESVKYLKKAVQLEPENGSYLDSLGWAYFKADKLDLAEPNLKRAAEQLGTNSVVQDHYGDLLFRLGRFDDAIAAWDRALGGDGDSIDKGEIQKKIHRARQKLKK